MSKELEKSIKHVFNRAKEMGDMYESETPHIAKKLNEDIEVVKELLKRNEPVKLLKEEGEERYGWDEWYMPVGQCPLCNEFNPVYAKYCLKCGQALEKIEEEECHG